MRGFIQSACVSMVLMTTIGLTLSMGAAEAQERRLAADLARGVHAFYQGNYASFDETARKALSLPYVSAFSFDVPWKLIEPSEGHYDWHLIDQGLSAAKTSNKKISLGLQVDWWAPNWVKERAAAYTFKHPIVGSKTSPVPWDPFYSRKLLELIKALGQRYNGNANILFVVIVGPATYWGTETNWVMVPGSIAPPDLQVLNFSLPKYEKNWRESIDAYFLAFPNTPLALALNDQIVVPDVPGRKRDPVSGFRTASQIRDYALQKQQLLKPGEKIWLELLGLSRGGDGHYVGPNTGPQSVTRFESLVWDVRDRVNVLYQNGVFMRPHHYTPEDVTRDLSIGISFDADAIEIYTGDLFRQDGQAYEPYRQQIEQAHKRLLHGRPGEQPDPSSVQKKPG